MSHEDSANEEHSLTSVAKSVYSADGVDLTLIRWMLSLTPAERLRVLQHSAQSILRLRHGNSDA
jgi:hypothetical protein